ncbi:Cytochrome b5 [Penicillium fimorum]|uniref:Cytochrome b5 n=1 Tax=Penicillium fimorum TaxID=1882269 RepID=A0A9W9Y0A3_9EURO|nr:Cytochrome b5 [Penicillium fimorum]
MSASAKQLTLQEVAKHSTKKDLYLILNDKIYDCTNFAKEHPGGEEVLLDLAGQDCTEAFDDVGHSDEARAVLDDPEMFIGTVKRMPGDPEPKSKASTATDSSSSSSASGFGIGLYAVILIGGAIAYGAYNYLQAQQAQQQ